MGDKTGTDVVLRAEGLRKTYRTGPTQLEILKGVDLEVRRGELVSIMGRSGVGKSTLLHLLGTLDRPTAGELCIRATDVLRLPEAALASFRNRHIGFVFQLHHLLPEFTALENVLMPAMIAEQANGRAWEEATDLMRRVGLESRLHHRPGELSGGECQRVAVVRALVMKPEVVLADEPSGNLDEGTSDVLHDLIRELARAYNQAFVIMTHDRTLAASMDRVGHLEAGVLRF
ncbi:MAG: ABC transporter ATP-binding protein [Candidatus Latescibacterota bacterium]